MMTRARHLRTRSLRTLGLALALGVGLLVTASAQTASNEGLVTLEAEQITLHAAMQLIIRNRDVSVVTGEALDEQISVRLRSVPWRRALESLLRTHGYRLVEEQGILRITRPTSEEKNKSQRIPLLIHPQHVPAGVMKPMLEPFLSSAGRMVVVEDGSSPQGALSILDEPESIDMIRNVLPTLDRPSPTKRASITRRDDGRVDFDIANLPVSEIDDVLREQLDLNVLLRKSAPGHINVSLQNVAWRDALKQILAEHGLAFRETADLLVIDDLTQFAAALATREFALQYADGWDVKPYLETMLSPEGKISCYSPSPRGGFQVGGDITEIRQETASNDEKRSKIISVTDHTDVLDTIAERIASLDVLPRQVEVSVKIIKITRERREQRGIDWDTILSLTGSVRPTTLPFDDFNGLGFPGEFPDPIDTDFTFGSLDASELRAVLRLIDQTDDAEILSEPNLTTLENIKASILIGQKFPVTTETIDPQTAVRTVTLDYYEDIGIQLLVFPSISDGDRVHLTIHPAVSSLAGLVEDRFPIIETRETDTQVLLRSGETVVIGGLVEQTVANTRKEIPWISQIPGLGRLFTYHDDVEITSELVILVTPRIVLTPEQMRESLLLPDETIRRLERNQSLLEGFFER